MCVVRLANALYVCCMFASVMLYVSVLCYCVFSSKEEHNIAGRMHGYKQLEITSS